MYLPKAAGWDSCAVPVLRMKPGNFPLGSAQSRAAARSLLAARKRSEAGKPGNLEGLAETIREVRMRHRTGANPALVGGQESIGRADCLSERIKRARERVAKWKHGLVTTL